MITTPADFNAAAAQQHIDQLRREAEAIRLVRAAR